MTDDRPPFTDHELDLGAAFLAGNRSQSWGVWRPEDSGLACLCKECVSEYARGWAVAVNGQYF